MNRSETVVEIQGLSKRFGRTQALDHVSIDFQAGRIVGLLGSNGAGKSTLLRHIVGMYLPDVGSCRTLGVEAGELDPATLARIGYVHQEGSLLDWMTCAQLIRYVAAHYPHWNRDLEAAYVDDFDIDLKKRVGGMSPGQRQKLAILLAIGHEPELLILDEPASGLDPLARAQFLDLLLQIIQQEQRTILISSHILSDVEKIIDHVMIMQDGRVVENCSLDTLREQYSRIRVTALSGDLPQVLPFHGVIATQRDGKQALVTVKQGEAELLKTQAAAHQLNIEIQALPLEDLYCLSVDQQPKLRKAGV